MKDGKPNGGDDLLAQAMRRVHREQVEGKEETDHKPAAPAKEVERQTESR